MWKKLLKYRDMTASFTKVDIRSGSASSFWYDVWSLLGRIIDITGVRGWLIWELILMHGNDYSFVPSTSTSS
ncbi:unnamed protein product [Brassica rapa subsp. narinosa]